jgi:hypothetical protein
VADETAGLGLLVLFEAARAEVVVLNAVFEHVVGGVRIEAATARAALLGPLRASRRKISAPRKGSVLWEAAQAACTRTEPGSTTAAPVGEPFAGTFIQTGQTPAQDIRPFHSNVGGGAMLN